MTNDQMRQRAFRSMLAREAGADADSPAIAAAARRLCERLAERVTVLVGAEGVAVICARSLQLTERLVPGLASGHACPHGDSPFAHLQVSLEPQEPTAATEAAVTVLTTASALLASFIGESLTASLLRETWPEEFGADTRRDT